jgi:hypothetical protein
MSARKHRKQLRDYVLVAEKQANKKPEPTAL